MASRTRTFVIGATLVVALSGAVIAGTELLRQTPTATHQASPSITPTATATSTLASTADRKKAIERDFLRDWQIRSDALRHLDPTRLRDGYTAGALRATTADVKRFRARNEPIDVKTIHHTVIVVIDPTTASVDDQYFNEDVFLDPHTMRPIGQRAHTKVHRTFTMRLEDGTWKIAVIIGYSQS